MSRIEKFGLATLYLGDMMELLSTLGPFDAIAPTRRYGINADARRVMDSQWLG